MTAETTNYRRLEARQIVNTIQLLHHRIEERFPGSGLGKVVAELLQVAGETVERARWIQKPHLPLRAAAFALSFAILILLVGLLLNIRQFQFSEYTASVQALDSSISSMVFIGAAILFLVSWESRIKRNRALKAIHELRALAHIIDMHQLTKNPESALGQYRPTSSSPKRTMNAFQLNRYLDYCGEAMALISKIAALYVQNFQDPTLLDAVDDVEDLTAGFSRKIWQKITLLEGLSRDQESPT
jgi:fumarate reductase subunit D